MVKTCKKYEITEDENGTAITYDAGIYEYKRTI